MEISASARLAVPPFGARLTQAMTHADVTPGDLTERLRAFGLSPADKYVYRLMAKETPERSPTNPTLFTMAALRQSLDVSTEWWLDPALTAADLPRLRLS